MENNNNDTTMDIEIETNDENEEVIIMGEKYSPEDLENSNNNQISEYQETESGLFNYEDIEDADSGKKYRKIQISNPKEIKRYLDKHIISQEDAKITISTAIYKHYLRIGQDPNDPVQIEKSNILIAGHSGSGKTHIARQVAKFLGLPFVIFDISNVSAAGYVGNDLVFCLRDLLDAAGGDLEMAQRGIIFIDEFNKIARKSGENNSITQDVNGEKVQGELLRMIEDGVCDVPTQRGRLNPEQPMIKMDCKNILFIFSGAFEGLDKIIARRIGTKKTVGFNVKTKDNVEDYDEDNLLKYIDTEDLLKYGIMRELISRIPTMTYVTKLSIDDLKRILVEPENAMIKQVKKLFMLHGINIEFTDDAINEIAELGYKRKTGARALKGIVERITDKLLYNIDSIEITNGVLTVDKQVVENSLKVE